MKARTESGFDQGRDLELRDELFSRDAGQLQDSAERPGRQFRMQWDNATSNLLRPYTFENNVAATLSNLSESQPFQCPNRFCP
jgi:hypothetical protein